MIALKIGVTSLIVYWGEQVGEETLGDDDEIDERRGEAVVAADEQEDKSTADGNDVVVCRQVVSTAGEDRLRSRCQLWPIQELFVGTS